MNIDYKYCIWLVNNQKNNWEKKDKGFQTHMSIKTHLDKNKAINFYNKIKKDINSIKLTISSKIIESKDDSGFNALYYNVKPDKEYYWWPENAHVSFQYKYNQEFTDDEKKYIPKINWCLFNQIKIIKCTNHHSKWEELQN